MLVTNIIIISIFVVLPIVFIYVASHSQSNRAIKAFRLVATQRNLAIHQPEVLIRDRVIGIDENKRVLLLCDQSNIEEIELLRFPKIELRKMMQGDKDSHIARIVIRFTDSESKEKQIELFNSNIDGMAQGDNVYVKAQKWERKCVECIK